jgi:hypothetical protein
LQCTNGFRSQKQGVLVMGNNLKILPKTIFVARRPDGSGGFFFAVEATAERLAEIGETVAVGRYELTESADVRAIPTVLPLARARAQRGAKPRGHVRRIRV